MTKSPIIWILVSIALLSSGALLAASETPAPAKSVEGSGKGSAKKPRNERKHACEGSLALFHGKKLVWTKASKDVREMKVNVRLRIQRMRNPLGVPVAELLPAGKKSGRLEFRTCAGKSILVDANRDDGLKAKGAFLVPAEKRAMIKLVLIDEQGNVSMLMRKAVAAYYPASE